MDESDARRLFGTVETLPVRPVDPATFQRSPGRAWVPVVAATVGVAAVVAAAAALPRDPHRPSPPVAAAPTCPGGASERSPRSPWPRPHGPADVMASPGPASVLVCSYASGNPAGSVTLEGDSDLAVRLVSALNAVEPTSRDYGCTMDDYTQEFLFFAYADGHEEEVIVSRRGCHSVFNGTRYAAYTSHLVIPLLDEALR